MCPSWPSRTEYLGQAQGPRAMMAVAAWPTLPQTRGAQHVGNAAIGMSLTPRSVTSPMKPVTWYFRTLCYGPVKHRTLRPTACRLLPHQVVSTNGDTHLGGEDFDQRVMEYFIKLIKKKYGKDVSKDARALQKLRREAERAKRALSSQHQVREPG